MRETRATRRFTRASAEVAPKFPQFLVGRRVNLSATPGLPPAAAPLAPAASDPASLDFQTTPRRSCCCNKWITSLSNCKLQWCGLDLGGSSASASATLTCFLFAKIKWPFYITLISACRRPLLDIGDLLYKANIKGPRFSTMSHHWQHTRLVISDI